MKKCFKCCIKKPLTDFYKHARMKDGHLNKCIECCKNYVHARRFGDAREKILAYDRARGNRQSASDLKAWRLKNPKKAKAHGVVRRAIKNKKLTSRPCEICGAIKTHAHHDNYNYPLMVRWLCPAHHKQWHMFNEAIF